MRLLAASCIFAVLWTKICAQDERPSSAVQLTSSTTATTTSSTSSTPVPTTASEVPAFPTSSAVFSPHPSPSPIKGLKDVVYAVTPSSPLPVSDPLNGPWLVPDYTDAWDKALSKARTFISSLSLEEKVNLTTGVGWMNGPCVGNIPAFSENTTNSLSIFWFTGICLQDSPTGVRYSRGVTAFPAALTVATTWSRRLARLRGQAMGEEFKAKGVHVALTPMANLGRVAEGGRNWEGFGADPWLSGEMAYESVIGLQSAGVQATAKHYINNEQEHARTWSSSAVDDRAQHELYSHPFLRMVQAGAASVMCSYNLINSTYACENDMVLNGLLKYELGFRGYVQSDWQATMSTLSASNGLDMTMPGDRTFNSGDSYFGGNLTTYVQNGTIPESRLDDMAERVMAGYFLLGQDEGYPDVGLYSWDLADPVRNNWTDVTGDHDELVREIAAKATVLLKNVNETLPLKKPRSIILVGSGAGPALRGPNGFVDRGGYDGTLAVGWGSGTTELPYLISPLEAVQRRARKDKSIVDWFLDDFDTAGAAAAVRSFDVAIVHISADSGEQYITVDGNEGDRTNLTAWKNGDELVKSVAGVNSNTVVVVHSVGPIVMEEWIDHPNVTAVLWAGLPGQEAGNALVDVLYGAVNPTGKLPFTIARDAADYNAPVIRGGTYGQDVLDVQYTESLAIDYRHFDQKEIQPRFAFGFGLSYTNFTYTKFTAYPLTPEADSAYKEQEDAWDRGDVYAVTVAATNGTLSGGTSAAWLHAPAYAVSFTLVNSGARQGAEVAQVYLHFEGETQEPPSVLRGFTDVVLERGESREVVITLSRYALSVWDTEGQGWKKASGKVGVSVGGSSRDLQSRGVLIDA